MPRTAAEFLEAFVIPLIGGGKLHVGQPLTAEKAASFAADLANASVPLVAADEARTAVIAELVARPPSLVLDEDEIYLAACLHNLLFLEHPNVGAVGVTKAARGRVLATAEYLSKRPLTQDRHRILARHGLLHNLFAITRTDVTLSWWSGRATFRGEAPPKRLLRWESLRRVRRETRIAAFPELFAADSVRPAVASLLRRSPLTLLLTDHLSAPEIHWEEVVFLLRDPEIARAIAYRAIADIDRDGNLALPARFAAGFEQMLERSPRPEDLRAVGAFLVYLSGLLAVAEISESSRSPLLAHSLAPERAGQRLRGLTTFFTLPAAMARVDERVSVPPGVVEDSAVNARWQIHRRHVADSVGDAVVEALAERLGRHISGPGRAAPVTD